MAVLLVHLWLWDADFGTHFREAIHSLMGDWPKEFGSPIKRDEVSIWGPGVVVTPVAAYAVWREALFLSR